MRMYVPSQIQRVAVRCFMSNRATDNIHKTQNPNPGRFGGKPTAAQPFGRTEPRTVSTLARREIASSHFAPLSKSAERFQEKCRRSPLFRQLEKHAGPITPVHRYDFGRKVRFRSRIRSLPRLFHLAFRQRINALILLRRRACASPVRNVFSGAASRSD